MHGRLWIVGVVLLVVIPASASARTEESVKAVGRAVEAVDERLPLAVPEPSAEALQFHATGHWVWGFARLWNLAVPLAILLTGASARMRDFARKVARGRLIPTVALYATLFLVLTFVVDLPLRYFAGFVRLHAYGLSNQSLGKWFGDSVKALLVDVAGASLFAWVPFWLIGRFPKSWWLIVSALSVPFTAFVVLITPVWIDPLFNDFGPMKDKALEAKIVALASRAGIPGGRVYEVNKSVDTKAMNAYVHGLFGTHRIVLWDTLLARQSEPEVLAVMGHEMGHYVLGHVEQGIVLSPLIVLVGLFWTDRAGRWLIARFGPRFGITSLADVAATPLLLLLLGVASTVIAPVSMAYSRHLEHEADRFGLELTRLNHSSARSFADFQRENLGIPQPDLFCKIFRSTHPSIAERITFCNTYHPWEEGRPLRYADRFAP